MKKYSKKVDMRSRTEMINFLTKHFRYNTMNSWNRSTSYANRVKIYDLGLSKEDQDKLWELIDCSEFYDEISLYLNRFAREHSYLWQVGFNGRSSGYLVLYQGFSKRSEYKSFCTNCGQSNYKTIEESGNCRCGRCGKDERVNYSIPPLEVGCYPGKSTDMFEDFEDWEMYSLRERVKLVCEFDALCDEILTRVCELIKDYEVEEEIVYRPETVKVMREVAV